MAISVRGGPHHSPGGWGRIGHCWGTALYVQLFFDDYKGRAWLQKELGHPKYTDGISVAPETYPDDFVTDGSIKDKWIGMKGIFYTKANGNPYVEMWIDKNASNDWERIRFKGDRDDEVINGKEDNGRNWPLELGKQNECGGGRLEKVTWGGPGVIFKLDGLKRLDMNRASIREIVPPEGWPLRYLLMARDVSYPVSMRSLAVEYGLTPPISLRELMIREAER